MIFRSDVSNTPDDLGEIGIGKGEFGTLGDDQPEDIALLSYQPFGKGVRGIIEAGGCTKYLFLFGFTYPTFMIERARD